MKLTLRHLLTVLLLSVTLISFANRNDKVKPSGTLPILYVNVYNEDGTTYNDEILDINLMHKEYFEAEYWLDINGCTWVNDEAYCSLGSKDAPLKTQIKARGNYTRTCFNKKPFKLKLDKKQNMLGLTSKKSKHYVLLAHADDNKGFLRNFIGFRLGKRMGLPWTPDQQPLELVINGDYRGLYFLTESIRVGDGRIMIEELDDNVEDENLVTGGYVVELNNNDDGNQIIIKEKSCIGGATENLRITAESPEIYSVLQERFITAEFMAMNNAIGENSDVLWQYMDMDDAARYYIVEEILSHTEAYRGSTYLIRDRGEQQKWHFSPLWDHGHAFEYKNNDWFYNNTMFHNQWIGSICANAKFQAKVKETWLWFMKSCYPGLTEEIDAYINQIRGAVPNDRNRWKNEPRPSYWNARNIEDNSNIDGRKSEVMNFMNAKISWLKRQWGDYDRNGSTVEPARDTTPFAPLPDLSVDPSDPILPQLDPFNPDDISENQLMATAIDGKTGQVAGNTAPLVKAGWQMWSCGRQFDFDGSYTYNIPVNVTDQWPGNVRIEQYEDSNVCSYLGAPYTGKIAHFRWDDPGKRDIWYVYPVTIEKEGTYEFTCYAGERANYNQNLSAQNYVSGLGFVVTLTSQVGPEHVRLDENPAESIANNVWAVPHEDNGHYFDVLWGNGRAFLTKCDTEFVVTEPGQYYLSIVGPYSMFSFGGFRLAEKHEEGTSSVNLIEDMSEVVSTTLYDLNGRVVINPTKGMVVIERSIMSDGSIRVTKRII